MSKLELQKIGGDTKLCAPLVPETETLPFEPSWEKFCASMHDQTGRVVPNQNSPAWKSYYSLWAIGYIAALKSVLKFSTKTPNENKQTSPRVA